MSRKKKAPKKIAVVDPKYKSSVIPKLINSIMYDGKKTIAEKIVYEAIDKIKTKSKDEPINIFNEAINNIKPTVEVRSRRIGGATFQIPMEIRPERKISMAMTWMIKFSRKRNEKSMVDRLAQEFVDANESKGASVKKKEDTHKMAEANRAFAHYRW